MRRSQERGEEEEEDLHHLTGVTAQGGALVLREGLVILILFNS